MKLIQFKLFVHQVSASEEKYVCEKCWNKVESFDSFYNFVKCIHQENDTRDTKSFDVIEHTEFLEVIKDEPDADVKDNFDDSTDIAGNIDSIAKSRDDVEEDNCSNADSTIETQTTGQSKRKRTATPSTSAGTVPKKFKTDSHSSLLSKYFNMSCDLCDTLLASYREANKHYKDDHNLDKGYLICCNKKFYRLQHMLQHCEWHINPESFKLIHKLCVAFNNLL